MPSPKWKLVVDIGDVEETAPVAAAATAASSTAASAPTSTTAMASAVAQATQMHPEPSEDHDFGILSSDVSAPAVTSTAGSAASMSAGTQEPGKKDPRIDEVIGLLGEHMPSDPNAPAANYLSGFMSLRLLLLRQTWSQEDEELVRTILDSFSSYASGGRDRGDIAMMLARDYIFLGQQQQSQNAFLGLGQNVMAPAGGQGASSSSSGGLSLFGLPSISSSLQNSPALTPIPAPGIIDSMSIVSNN